MHAREWMQCGAAHTYFRPVNLFAWDHFKWKSLIKSVSVMREKKKGDMEICKRGWFVYSNYNDGFIKDPFVTLCVEYADASSTAREVATNDAPEKMYVLDVQWLEFEYAVKDPTCPIGTEAVTSDSGKSFKFAGYETTYFVFSLARTRALVNGGTRISNARFLKKLRVDVTKDRPQRITIEQHDPIYWRGLGYNDSNDKTLVNTFFDCSRMQLATCTA